tara:strand:- start:242 stop:1306 length:1065 start_codon:yes stop_codon:yes gene_type:complete
MLRKEDLQAALDAYENANENGPAAAKSLGIKTATFYYQLNLARAHNLIVNKTEVELPDFPDEDIETTEILNHLSKRFEKKLKYQQSKNWFEIKINSDMPVGLAVVGDPHLGTSCNIPLLKRDVKIMAETEGIMALNLGDTADNWGRMIYLYAEDDISKPTERKLARWFLKDAGIPWVIWLMGNHDLMHTEFSTYLKSINVNQIVMEDWRAKFRLCFPSTSIKIDAAHNHKGTSIYNPLHGQKRSALWDEDADLYLAGHHHTWAMSAEELDGGRVINMARARGYKWIDDYAKVHGFSQDEYGATILFVIDPLATNPVSRLKGFVDLADGADYLKYLRHRQKSKLNESIVVDQADN